MIIRKLRLKRGWTQEQLAQLTGLNVRTIQRLEQGQTPSLETQKSLAAVFEVDIATFSPTVNSDTSSESHIQPSTTAENTPGDARMNDNIQNQTLSETRPEQKPPIETLESDEKSALSFAKNAKDFLANILFFVIFTPLIIYKVGLESPAIWVLLAWLATIVIQGLHTFEKINIFNVDWEKKIAEWKLGRKL